MRVLRRIAGLPAGDPERERLRVEVIEDHMPYARHIARRYSSHCSTGEDFEQIAFLGLVKAVDNFDPEHGRPPTLPELSAHMGVRIDELVEALDASEAYRTTSLDRPVTAEPGAASLGELLGGDDPGYELAVDLEVLRGLLKHLAERDRRILSMRFVEGLTQAEIGARLGVSQMQVSRLIAKILATLRAGFG